MYNIHQHRTLRRAQSLEHIPYSVKINGSVGENRRGREVIRNDDEVCFISFHFDHIRGVLFTTNDRIILYQQMFIPFLYLHLIFKAKTFVKKKKHTKERNMK